MHSSRASAGLTVVACLLLAQSASAEPRAALWLRDHLVGEWMVAVGGWRTSLGLDAHVPGFQMIGGGTELDLGLEIYAGLGLVLSGRFLIGVAGAANDELVEGLGGLALQWRVNDTVRLRLGAAAGQAAHAGEQRTLVGGYLAGSFDLFALGAGRLALALAVRLDIDGLVGAATGLPAQSLALALGLGFRY